jgi:hypothetical protein
MFHLKVKGTTTMSVSLIRNGLKQGEGLLPLFFNFALEYAIRRIQINHVVLKINGTLQLLVYAADVNIMGGRVHTRKGNTKSLLADSKEFGLEVNVDKTKYMVTPRDLNAGRSQIERLIIVPLKGWKRSNILEIP